MKRIKVYLFGVQVNLKGLLYKDTFVFITKNDISKSPRCYSRKIKSLDYITCIVSNSIYCRYRTPSGELLTFCTSRIKVYFGSIPKVISYTK